MSDRNQVEAQIALSRKKSQIIGLVLTFFLGPFGLFYVSVLQAIIALIISGIIIVITFGVLSAVVFPMAMIWSFFAVGAHNHRCEREALDSVR